MYVGEHWFRFILYVAEFFQQPVCRLKMDFISSSMQYLTIIMSNQNSKYLVVWYKKYLYENFVYGLISSAWYTFGKNDVLCFQFGYFTHFLCSILSSDQFSTILVSPCHHTLRKYQKDGNFYTNLGIFPFWVGEIIHWTT